jgi:hypothetical protein
MKLYKIDLGSGLLIKPINFGDDLTESELVELGPSFIATPPPPEAVHPRWLFDQLAWTDDGEEVFEEVEESAPSTAQQIETLKAENLNLMDAMASLAEDVVSLGGTV